ncbi:probable DNA replication complex GINS protein PSF3 [Coccomyxa sp. Obi]|nr:probable DNA replication complex GINS protein PSF3 [Coccomyxa sp. Obi]
MAGRGARQGGDYYSLDAVLAEETLIPCMFKVGSRGVGRALDPSSGSEDVKQRAAVELPLWMLQPLTSRDMLSVKVPRWYGEKMRRKIQAGAGVENLRLRCPYFYNVALALHSIDGAPSVADLVISTFRSRYKEILTKAHANESAKEMARIEALLSIEEAALFNAGRASVDALNRWRFGGRAVLTRPSAKRRLDGAPANGAR